MKTRLAIPALVGVITFFSVSLAFNFAWFHSPVIWYRNTSSAAGIAAPVYGVLFGAINAAVIFGIRYVLKTPSD